MLVIIYEAFWGLDPQLWWEHHLLHIQSSCIVSIFPWGFREASFFYGCPKPWLGIIFPKSRKSPRFKKLVKSLLFCRFFLREKGIKEMAVTCCVVSDIYMLCTSVFSYAYGFLKYFKIILHMLGKWNMLFIWYFIMSVWSLWLGCHINTVKYMNGNKLNSHPSCCVDLSERFVHRQLCALLECAPILMYKAVTW